MTKVEIVRPASSKDGFKALTQGLCPPLAAPVLGLLDEVRPLGEGSEWVFPGAGGQGHRVAIHKAHNRIRRRSGVPFVPHDLGGRRHRT